MAFTPEDGTGVAGANSYTTVEFADAYFADRPTAAAWTAVGDATAKKTFLIAATDYVEGRFATRMIGEPLTDTQGLHFPATDADPYVMDEVPLPLQKAICEYAIRAKGAPLAPDPLMDPANVSVVNTMKKVGPLEKQFEVVGSKFPQMFRPYPAADMLLRTVLQPAGNKVYR